MTDYVFNGITYNTNAYDAATNPYGLAEGGHRPNLLPMLENVLADVASGMICTSVTSRTIGAGAFVFTLDTYRPIPIGATVWALTVDSANKMFGTVTARDATAGTLTLTVASDGAYGAGTYAAWTLMPTGPKGATSTEYWSDPVVVTNAMSPYSALDRALLLVRTSTGAVEIDFPATGRIKVVDIDGNASVNNITLDPAGADTCTIDAIDTDYFSCELHRRTGGTNWEVL